MVETLLQARYLDASQLMSYLETIFKGDFQRGDVSVNLEKDRYWVTAPRKLTSQEILAIKHLEEKMYSDFDGFTTIGEDASTAQPSQAPSTATKPDQPRRPSPMRPEGGTKEKPSGDEESQQISPLQRALSWASIKKTFCRW